MTILRMRSMRVPMKQVFVKTGASPLSGHGLFEFLETSNAIKKKNPLEKANTVIPWIEKEMNHRWKLEVISKLYYKPHENSGQISDKSRLFWILAKWYFNLWFPFCKKMERVQKQQQERRVFLKPWLIWLVRGMFWPLKRKSEILSQFVNVS